MDRKLFTKGIPAVARLCSWTVDEGAFCSHSKVCFRLKVADAVRYQMTGSDALRQVAVLRRTTGRFSIFPSPVPFITRKITAAGGSAQMQLRKG